jgi:hypothetical protein
MKSLSSQWICVDEDPKLTRVGCHSDCLGIILAKRNALDKNWLNACRDIRAFLAKENLSSFNVEIADKRAFELPRYPPVLPSDAIFCVWDKVWDQILMKLDLKDIKCIECFRMGTSDNHKENPPTVILTVVK